MKYIHQSSKGNNRRERERESKWEKKNGVKETRELRVSVYYIIFILIAYVFTGIGKTVKVIKYHVIDLMTINYKY